MLKQPSAEMSCLVSQVALSLKKKADPMREVLVPANHCATDVGDLQFFK